MICKVFFAMDLVSTNTLNFLSKCYLAYSIFLNCHFIVQYQFYPQIK